MVACLKVTCLNLIGDRMLQNRTMAEDLVSMLCTDALVMARSTLARAWAYHTTATRIYFSDSCTGYLYDVVDQRPEVKVSLTPSLVATVQVSEMSHVQV